MDIIQPFPGFRYDPARVDAAKVVAPPYDVIDDDERDILLARDPHNVVELILNPIRPGDGDDDNRYTRAAAALDAWRREGIFVRDRPAFYLYRQNFAARGPRGGATTERVGFFARVMLSPWGEGGVYPHEKTLAGPKADRLSLMRATHGNLEPVFSLLADAGGRVRQAFASILAADPAPVLDVVEDDGCRDRLFVLDRPDAVAGLADIVRNAPRLYIADGHHRYETALKYRDEVRQKMRDAGQTPPPLGELASDYILMLIVPDDDPGLVIWPTHRVIHGVAGFDAARLLAGARELFDVQSFAGGIDGLAAAMDAAPAPAFGMLLPDGGKSLLVLRQPVGDEAMRRLAPAEDPAWRALDVSVLHTLILEKSLGIDAGKLLRKENVDYARYADEAEAAVREGRSGAQCAFLVRATTMAQIRAVADAGAVMPQKSTYFYPKALSGMLFHFFD